MPNLHAVAVGLHLGPVYTEQTPPRNHYEHVQGETCSLTDRVFQDKLHFESPGAQDQAASATAIDLKFKRNHLS